MTTIANLFNQANADMLVQMRAASRSVMTITANTIAAPPKPRDYYAEAMAELDEFLGISPSAEHPMSAL